MSSYGAVPFSWAADDTASKLSESSPPPVQTSAPQQAKTTVDPLPDTSARKRVGKASFYAKQFSGKPMADGVPMDPQGDNAASRTLPLGTTAKVTNVETGKTAIVTIEDRGPYVDGRLVDLSPGTAAKIGLTPRQGITKVVVAPIAVPLPNGTVKAGAAAHEPDDKPDQIPVHDDKVTSDSKLAHGDKSVHDEKAARDEKPAHDGKLAGVDKAAAARAKPTKLADAIPNRDK
jgi:rare lipoprotein A